MATKAGDEGIYIRALADTGQGLNKENRSGKNDKNSLFESGSSKKSRLIGLCDDCGMGNYILGRC
jgi:hypothetical protein